MELFGREIVCSSAIYKDEELITLPINGNNYFKLRDLAQAFNISVTWDGNTNSVIIDTSKVYLYIPLKNENWV
ncbi:MAG: hypothetical protein GX213_14345 [Clostridiaceae bacterium]|nr:hypothetical protein [Clostridiaceae bacterium]